MTGRERSERSREVICILPIASGCMVFSACPSVIVQCSSACTETDWYFIAEQPALAPHLAHPEECAALRSVLAPAQRHNARVMGS